MHNSGEQLNQLTGVAAILNFPLKEPNSDEDKESSEKDDDDESVEWSTSSSDESSEDNF